MESSLTDALPAYGAVGAALAWIGYLQWRLHSPLPGPQLNEAR